MDSKVPTGTGYVSSLKNGFYKFCFMNCKLGAGHKALLFLVLDELLLEVGKPRFFLGGGCCIDVQRYQIL